MDTSAITSFGKEPPPPPPLYPTVEVEPFNFILFGVCYFALFVMIAVLLVRYRREKREIFERTAT